MVNDDNISDAYVAFSMSAPCGTPASPMKRTDIMPV